MATSDAPVEIGHVILTVHDLAALSAFYERAVGLERMASDGESARLGAGGRVLVELRRDASARRSSPREAGLFHTAFLLPDRRDLGALLNTYAERGDRLDGASDHAVSEALYLSDPEGNGIEIYTDRPRAAWPRGAGGIEMTTERLDISDLMRSASGPWAGAPAGTVVGHVHLRVGEIPAAEAFYTGTLGMDLVTRYPGGSFYATGGYHHHIATNTWQSRGAAPRSGPVTGLAEVVLRADAPVYDRLAERASEGALTDPWNTRFTLERKPV